MGNEIIWKCFTLLISSFVYGLDFGDLIILHIFPFYWTPFNTSQYYYHAMKQYKSFLIGW